MATLPAPPHDGSRRETPAGTSMTRAVQSLSNVTAQVCEKITMRIHVTVVSLLSVLVEVRDRPSLSRSGGSGNHHSILSRLLKSITGADYQRGKAEDASTRFYWKRLKSKSLF